MEKKNIISLGALLMILVVFAAIIFNILINRSITNIEEPDRSVTPQIEYEGFNLEYNYKGENTWEYTVIGTLPNPCYKIKSEAIVLESFPEQVIIKSIIIPPSVDIVCAQVIQDVLEKGEFEASENATVTFEIE